MAKPTALGASIFGGGFTIGMRKSFQILAHIEESNYGVPTVRKNFPRLPVHVGFDKWPVDDFKGVDVVYGNPPCAAWSRTGKMIQSGVSHWKTDGRVDCTRRHFTLLERLRPLAWVWESVPGAFRHGRPFVNELAERAADLGYSATYVLHNAQYLGAPQHRERFFCVFHRVDIPWRLPIKDWEITAMDILKKMKRNPGAPHEDSALRRLNAKDRRGILAKLPQGAKFKDEWTRYMLRKHKADSQDELPSTHLGITGRPGIGHVRIYEDRPSLAIVGYMMVHPTEPRALSIEEMSALCGFPSDYEFVTTRGQTPSLMARGVLPPVGEWLGRELARGVKRKKHLRGKPHQYVLDIRKPPGRLFDIADDTSTIPFDRSMLR